MTSQQIRLTVFFLCLALYLLGAIGICSINLPAAVSPFLWLTALLGGSLVYFIAVPALMILVCGLIKKRFFCRFLCPMGCSFQLMEKAFFCCGKKPFKEGARKHFFHWNYFGKAFALLTFLCAAFHVSGMNGFQFLDPLILFGMFFNFQSWNPLIFLTIFLLFFSAFRPHFWCVNFCPLGALQDMIHRLVNVVFRRLSREKRKDSEKDLSCLSQKESQKGSHCAKEINQDESVNDFLLKSPSPPVSAQRKGTPRRTDRRDFLLLIPFLFLLALGRKTVLQLQRTGRFFRPPGTCGTESQFTSLCTSCGRCIAACPTKHLISLHDFIKGEKRNSQSSPDKQTKQDIISNRSTEKEKLSGSQIITAGLPSIPSIFELTPVLETKSTFCDAKCNICSRICPTGALRPFSLEKKKSLQIGIAKYEFDNCVLYNSKDCNICVRECPYEAIGLVWNEDLYINIPTVDPDKCTGCGRCVVFCPGFDPVWHGEENEEESAEENNEATSNQKSGSANDESSSSAVNIGTEIKEQVSSTPPKAFTIVSREDWEAMSSAKNN